MSTAEQQHQHSPADRTRILARTLDARMREVKDEFVDREEVVDLLALAVLCREHILLVGPPGTAKTRLLQRFCRVLDTTPFTYLLTRFTEPAELFGALDLKKFQNEGVYEVDPTGMLPEARIAFLDEVFQGSSAILNTLLSLVNERTFFTGHRTVRGRLITLLGSSNEIPDDPVLAAFGDRFLFRFRMDYVSDDALGDVLSLGWRAEQQQIRREHADPAAGSDGRTVPYQISREQQAEVTFSLEDLLHLQQTVASIDISAVREPYTGILRALRAEGVTFSDRRAVKAQKAFAARALLAGRLSAQPEDLAVLTHLWTDPHDELSMRRIVADHGVPLDSTGRTLRHSQELAIELRELTNRLAGLHTAEEVGELLGRLSRLTAEARTDHPGEQRLAASLAQARRQALTKRQELQIQAEEATTDV